MILANPVPSAGNPEVFELSSEFVSIMIGTGPRIGAGCRADGKNCRAFTGD